VPQSTLQTRTKGVIPIKESNQAKRKLCIGEEEALRDWCIQLGKWGWPPRVCQLRTMALELLRAKSDKAELGIHWQEAFLSRFPDLKTKYIGGLDKNRFSAQNPIIIKDWFNLFSRIKSEFNVHPSNIYNIDEKGFTVGMLQCTKVVISKYEI